MLRFYPVVGDHDPMARHTIPKNNNCEQLIRAAKLIWTQRTGRKFPCGNTSPLGGHAGLVGYFTLNVCSTVASTGDHQPK